jgi:hypothetical protein
MSLSMQMFDGNIIINNQKRLFPIKLKVSGFFRPIIYKRNDIKWQMGVIKIRLEPVRKRKG